MRVMTQVNDLQETREFDGVQSLIVVRVHRVVEEALG